MVRMSKTAAVDAEKQVFDITDEHLHRGAWWWWFWLFFIENPAAPEKPRQLMILWSVKNVPVVDCNYLKIRADNSSGSRSVLDGVAAAWYFDGEEMHHNFLLEQCNLHFKDSSIAADSTPSALYSITGRQHNIRLGSDFEFTAEENNGHIFTGPTYNSDIYYASRGYSIIKINHLKMSGKIRGEAVRGSAYFQRVFVTTPSPSWYWGIFHFEGGAALSYFNPYLLGRSLKKTVSFFDGKEIHKLKNLEIQRIGQGLPEFKANAENRSHRIEFTVKSYSHSDWTFKRNVFGFIPSRLVYNEYPAVISELKFTNKETGEKVTLNDLGKSVGNAEHATGALL